MKIIALPEVRQYLKELSYILYEKGYFVFEDTSEKYVEELFHDIKTTLHIRLHKSVPKYFDKYGKGMEYAIFRKNKQTSWYIFFRVYRYNGEDIYLIRYIANNHTISQYLQPND